MPLAAVNHSFEADPNNANEFYFGDPAGWSLIDNSGIIDLLVLRDCAFEFGVH